MTPERVLFLCTHKSARSQRVFRRVRDEIADRIRGWLAERTRS